MQNTIQQYSDMVLQYATEAGFKVLAAIVFWIVGRWLIGLAGRLLQGALGRRSGVARWPGICVQAT